MAKAPATEIDVGGRTVRISNPDRVYFPATRGHEARPRRVLPGGRPGHRERPARAAVHAPPVPQGARGRQGPPEAGARRGAAVARDGAAALPPLRPARRRAVRHRAGPGDLGGADVDGRVPPVELAPGAHRAARRVAHRPRPDARVPARAGARGGRRRPRGARRPGGGRLAEDVGGPGAARVRAGRARPRLPRRAPRCAGLRPRGRAAGARRRDDDVVAQGPRPRGTVRRLQPERPRPHDGGRLLGAGPPRGHGVDADHVGRGRHRRGRGLHDGDRPRPLRRAGRPPRRHRRRPVRPRPAARVGGPRRGRGRRGTTAARRRRPDRRVGQSPWRYSQT